MSLIKCPDCEKMISDTAPTCLGCGRLMITPIQKYSGIINRVWMFLREVMTFIPDVYRVNIRKAIAGEDNNLSFHKVSWGKQGTFRSDPPGYFRSHMEAEPVWPIVQFFLVNIVAGIIEVFVAGIALLVPVFKIFPYTVKWPYHATIASLWIWFVLKAWKYIKWKSLLPYVVYLALSYVVVSVNISLNLKVTTTSVSLIWGLVNISAYLVISQIVIKQWCQRRGSYDFIETDEEGS